MAREAQKIEFVLEHLTGEDAKREWREQTGTDDNCPETLIVTNMSDGLLWTSMEEMWAEYAMHALGLKQADLLDSLSHIQDFGGNPPVRVDWDDATSEVCPINQVKEKAEHNMGEGVFADQIIEVDADGDEMEDNPQEFGIVWTARTEKL